MKFYEGTTTLTQERVPSNDMEFPQLMICSQIGYKTDVLTEMELPKNVLNTIVPRNLVENNYDFDAQSVWDNGTYSLKDLEINQFVMKGKPISFCLIENLFYT